MMHTWFDSEACVRIVGNVAGPYGNPVRVIKVLHMYLQLAIYPRLVAFFCGLRRKTRNDVRCVLCPVDPPRYLRRRTGELSFYLFAASTTHPTI